MRNRRKPSQILAALLTAGALVGCREETSEPVAASSAPPRPAAVPLFDSGHGLVLRGEEKEPAVLAVLVEDLYWMRIDLVLAAWADGEVAWSSDPLRGGPPYLTTRMDPARLASAVASIHRFLETEAGTLAESGLVEHEPILVVGAALDGRWCQTESNRTPFDRGIEDTPSGRRRQLAWTSLLEKVRALTPDAGEPKDTDSIRARFRIDLPQDHPLGKPEGCR